MIELYFFFPGKASEVQREYNIEILYICFTLRYTVYYIFEKN